MAVDGTFVVTWRGPDLDYSTGIQARMYDANGVPIVNATTGTTGQFRVNALASATYFTPAIGMRASDKSFVIVWAESKTGTILIYGQRFSAAGAKIGTTNFKISTYVSSKSNPDVDVAGNGDFVVVWNSDNQGLSSFSNVYGQRYNSAGTALGSEFEISSTGSSDFESVYPRVSRASNGLFVVVWQRYTDGSGYGVYGQRYNAAGTAQGSEFRANTHTLNYQWYPDVACDSDGNFVVVWSSFDQDDIITSDYGIIGREYNAAGSAVTGEFILNNPNLEHRGIGDQINPAVTRKAGSGQWVAAWAGYQGIAPSGGVLGIWRLQVTDPSDARRQPIPAVSWTLTAPISGGYPSGSVIPVSWYATGVQTGYTINLAYIDTIDWSGTAHWISVGAIVAYNGWTVWNWDTTGVPPGTYYIAGYIWDGASAHYAHATTTFIIT